MNITIIEQYDNEGNIFKWVAVDEETARELWELQIPLFYVRSDAEGLIEDAQDLEKAILHNSVCPEENYTWIEDFEEGRSNRERNNNFISFEEWATQKIENYY